jgi:hypothetical protein
MQVHTAKKDVGLIASVVKEKSRNPEYLGSGD